MNIRVTVMPVVLKADMVTSLARTEPAVLPAVQGQDFDLQAIIDNDGLAVRNPVTFKPGQIQLLKESLGWLHHGHPKLMRVTGYAGTGKTTVAKYLILLADHLGILDASDGEIWGCGPTHQACSVLEESLDGVGVAQVATAHSILGLRPQEVEFSLTHMAQLADLEAVPIEQRTSDQLNLIVALTDRRHAAEERLQRFMPTTFHKDLAKVRLLIVDEWSMIDTTLFGLFVELINSPKVNSKLQVLFLGDPAQLPPVNEHLSKIAGIPGFSELTEIARNSGSIAAYGQAVREAQGLDYLSLHQTMPHDDNFFVATEWEIMDQVAELFNSGESVRFVAATNARVNALNFRIRSIIKADRASKSGRNHGLFYETGDTVLTTAAVSRAPSRTSYGIGCKGKDAALIEGTNSLLKLTQMCGVGDYVDDGMEPYRLDEKSFTYVSALGTTYNRLAFRYEHVGNQPVALGSALFLLDPKKFVDWNAECDKLKKIAKSTRSRSSSSPRGQMGDYAKEAWKILGLKNWDTRLDGSAVSAEQHGRNKTKLWNLFFALLGFADSAGYSYASTFHKCQGVTVDTCIVDMQSVRKLATSPRAFSEENTFDCQKALYTGATRPRNQLVIMESA